MTIGDATAPLGGSPQPMMLRAQPFAAILPGDGVAELVITSSITSFLVGAAAGDVLRAPVPGGRLRTGQPSPTCATGLPQACP